MPSPSQFSRCADEGCTVSCLAASSCQTWQKLTILAVFFRFLLGLCGQAMWPKGLVIQSLHTYSYDFWKTFLSYMCIYSTNILSVGLLVSYKRQKCKNMETRFSWPLIEIDGCFFLCTFSLIYEHLFYKYFVRQSVSQATKGRVLNIQKCLFISWYFRKNSDFFSEDWFSKYFARLSDNYYKLWFMQSKWKQLIYLCVKNDSNKCGTVKEC